MIVATTCSSVAGMAGAYLAVTFAGPGSIGFILGSSIGFIGGMWHYHRSYLNNALSALKRYPSLILLHLKLNYPAVDWERYESMEVNGQMRVGPALMNSNMTLRSMAIAAWQSAGSAIHELQARQEAAAIEEYARIDEERRQRDIAQSDQPNIQIKHVT